ncbi:similar to tyrosine-protein kinase HTK16 [Rhodopirellula baltica SH 1]|nr:similar to tyrosine-protein kinase HTK16 [Rhodopirellula baltica SH 1]
MQAAGLHPRRTFGVSPSANMLTQLMDHIRHRTPLHEACTQGDTRTVRALLEYGADKYALDANAQTPAESAASHN